MAYRVQTPRPPSAPAQPGRASGAETAFVRDERGAMTLLGFVTFVLMLLAAGVAIDSIRHEERRADLQYALDRGVLAASSLNQKGDPETVVRDYISAAGLEPDDVDIQVADATLSRRVTATMRDDVPSVFLQLLGIESMSAPARSKALDEMTDVEIALVLDVSGSMGETDPSDASDTTTKLDDLKNAVGVFIDEVLTPDARDRTTISIVPYHESVNVGPLLDGPYLIDDDHAESSCGKFTATDFTRTDLAPGRSLDRLAHFDPYSYDPKWNDDDDRDPWSPSNPVPLERHVCDADDLRAIMPWSNDGDALKAHVNGFYASGNTAADIGVKWGGLLLDPYSAPMLNSLIASNDVHTDHVGRPFAYGRDRAAKVLIVMSDGRNTNQYDLIDSRKGDAGSGIWMYQPDMPAGADTSAIHAGDNYDPDGTARYSIRVQSRVDDGAAPYWDPVSETYAWNPVGGSDAFELSWQQLYARMPANYIYNELATAYRWWDGKGLEWNDRKKYAHILTRIGDYTDANGVARNDGDDNLSPICEAIRDQGVRLITIAFDAGDRGTAALEDCGGALSNNNYVATDDTLEQVYRNIAASINELGLRQ